MKIIKIKYGILSETIRKSLLIALSFALLSCSESTPIEIPQSGSGEIQGSVKDENGNPYPGVLITLSKGSEEIITATDNDGTYSIITQGTGAYNLDLVPPLSTNFVGSPPTTVNIMNGQTGTVNFVVRPKPAIAHLNFGSVQLLEEIVDQDGNTPTSPSTPLYARNIFDPPLGQLNTIKAPDGHHIILSEFEMAKGSLLVSCNGDSSTIEITLEGMIPNGTYTFWLAYLKITRKVGEQIDFMNDFVNFNNPPIGASNGTENIVIAGADGTLTATLQHNSCILTDEVALVIPILYHLNGMTFGGGHVPDAEEMVHMLVYFQ